MKGFKLVEILIAAGLILLIGTGEILGVRAARRISRDAVLLSSVRSAQAELIRYFHQRQSYPETESRAASAPDATRYRALPEGCVPAGEAPCSGYELSFRLEGPVGAWPGGACLAKPDGLTCS